MTMEEVDCAVSGKAVDMSWACCASCGIAEVDDIKLMTCTACKLVRYCSVACQKYHRPQHKRACKKRMAELRDDLLFAQPESSCYGDCPICVLPLPLDERKHFVMTCCCKVVCDGCNYADKLRQRQLNLNGPVKCPFCRHPLPTTRAESNAGIVRRIQANDPVAMRAMGGVGLSEGDYTKACQYFSKAAALGDAISHHHLSSRYSKGQGVEKDEKKAIYHWEEAAILGHPKARFNLGVIEWNCGSEERAVKHFIIAANLGDDKAVKMLKNYYEWGMLSKDDYAAALRAHQAAVDETKSPRREAADAEPEEDIWS